MVEVTGVEPVSKTRKICMELQASLIYCAICAIESVTLYTNFSKDFSGLSRPLETST
jgi:hypothetical protein